MTKREFINDVLENYAGLTDEGREVANKILASLDKKSNTPTKRQTENEEIKTRLGKVLQRLGLPTGPADEDMDKDAILSLVLNDKKAGASGVDIIRVREMGRALIEHADRDEIRRIIG